MLIVIYNQWLRDSKEEARELCSYLKPLFGNRLKVDHQGLTIDIDDVRVDYRFGNPPNLHGLRPDYYHCDDWRMNEYFKYRGGKNLKKHGGLLEVIEEHFKNKEVSDG